MTSSEVAQNVENPTRVSRILSELVKKGLANREQRQVAGSKSQVFYYWSTAPTSQSKEWTKRDDCDEDMAPGKQLLHPTSLSPNAPKSIEAPATSIQSSIHISPDLENELTEFARDFAHRCAKSAVLREKIDHLKMENAQLDGQMVADTRRIKALKIQNEALREALEIKQAIIKDESDQAQQRINQLAHVQRNAASTSEILSFLKKLRERPALEPLVLLKQVQDDYEKALYLVRGE